jgi:hypothetical protein
VPTSEFDPRPMVSMVQELLQKKERRMHVPNQSSYVGRDFVKKFISS